MKRILTLLLSSIFLFSCALRVSAAGESMSGRKKVAVVLSGGGAKGAAHVRVLKVIEEAGIPIDIVVGTSMGSIVGGLYASGYTTDQLDSLIRSQNWVRLLTDGRDRNDQNLDIKQMMEKYIVSGVFEKSPFEVIEGGILKGNSIGKLFSELTADRLDSMDYRDLNIPFACVATDIVNGEEVDMYSGILAESMRSSMAIPGVFSPIRKNGRVLVDGGLVNNYPADIAKKMGADIIIGVDVSATAKSADEISTTADVLYRILDIICSNKYNENKAITDVFIDVDVNGYSSASFSPSAIDTLLARGESAARGKWDELMALRKKVGVTRALTERNPKVLDSDTVVTPVPSIYSEGQKNSFLGLGARFDNEELASILLGGSYEFNHDNKMRGGVEARLGKRTYGKLNFSVAAWKKLGVGAMYKYSDNEIRLYNRGVMAANLDFSEHRAGIYFNRVWRNMLVTFGGEWSSSRYSSLLVQSDWVDFVQTFLNEKSVSYYVKVEFDNHDSSVLPHSGMKWSVKYNYYTDNGYKFGGHRGLNIVEGYFNAAIPLSSSFTLLPSVSGRLLPNKNSHLNNMNFIGGVDSYGHYMPQQLSFAGVNYMQIAPNNILILGTSLRWSLTTNNYVFCLANYALSGNAFEKIMTVNSNNLFGAVVGYGYKSPVGPISLNVGWSNVTHSVNSFLNLGYMF